jgi:hypothetical protein
MSGSILQVQRRRVGAARYYVVEFAWSRIRAWSEHGRWLSCDPKTARKRAIAALEAVFATGLLQ